MKKKITTGDRTPGYEGVVVSHYGVKVLVRCSNGGTSMVHVKRNSGHVVGDRVLVSSDGHLQRQPRHTLLNRQDVSGRVRPLAANLDSLGIVVAPRPQSPPGFIERIMVAAYAAGIKPFLVLNKTDLDEAQVFKAELEDSYAALMPLVVVSAKTGRGLDALRHALTVYGRTVLVGVSGAGKSSLLNALVPDMDLAVGELNEREHGCHVTSASTLIALPDGGELVDTPGFRDFTPVDVSSEDLAYWYPGFSAILEHSPCKFRNCRHRQEPGCSIVAAVADATLKSERYELYLRTLAELEEHEQLMSQRGR